MLIKDFIAAYREEIDAEIRREWPNAATVLLDNDRAEYIRRSDALRTWWQSESRAEKRFGIRAGR